jgi:LacI family transcriptional regulator
MIVEGDHTIESEQKGFQSFRQLKSAPSAILCSNDMTAIGVMHAAFDAGLRIPNDLSVIGFDDISLSRHILPPLFHGTHVLSEIGARAVNCLHALVEGQTEAMVNAPILTSLVVRQSTDILSGSLADLQVRNLRRSDKAQPRQREMQRPSRLKKS